MENTVIEIWRELERLENVLDFSSYHTLKEGLDNPHKTPDFTYKNIYHQIDYSHDDIFEIYYWLETDDDFDDGRLMEEYELQELLYELKNL